MPSENDGIPGESDVGAGLVGETSEGLRVEPLRPDTERKPGDTNVER